MEFLKIFLTMFKSPFVLIMLIFSLFSVKLAAIEVTGLYQASVVVESQAYKERQQAIKIALQGVFLKIGGNKSVLSNDVLKKAQKKASRYINQYRYQRQDEQLSLVVSFNEDKVNQLFEQANLPLWGSLRPQVLLWLIDEQGARRSIVASDTDSIISSNVNDFSVQRGLPIIMPLMDLTDNEFVVVSDFWGYFPEQIQQASLRYFADTVVVMRVSNSSLVPDEFKVAIDDSFAADTFDNESCGLLCQEQEVDTPKVLDWRVYTQGALYTQQYIGVDKPTLINQGLADITALIHQSYALLSSAENDFVIEVENVTSLKNDTQLFSFLTDLSAVKNVTLTSAQGNIRRFKLDLVGSKASFLASLKLNDKLTQKIASQRGDFSQTGQPFEQNNTETGFNDVFHHGVKVIVLGEPISTVEDSKIPPLDDMQDYIKDNAQDKVQVITSPEGDNTVDENTIIAPVKDDLSKPADEQIPQLKITPNIPIFYWEQG